MGAPAMVEVALDVIAPLRRAGVHAARLIHDPSYDVSQQLRETLARLELTQEQFALRYGLDLDALQNWEQERRTPDRAIASYLRVIERDPEGAARAQEED